MSDIQMQELIFNQYSEEKQREEILRLFDRIQDKGRLYGMALIIYQREERERNSNIIPLRAGENS